MNTPNDLPLLPVAHVLYESHKADLDGEDLRKVRREADQELDRIMKRADAQRRALGIRV